MNKATFHYLLQGCIFLLFTNVFCQKKLKLILLDKSDQTPLEFINVINLNSRTFYYSDVNGKVEFTAQPTDSILFNQMGYHEIKEQVQNLPKVLYLEPNISTLDEVVLVDRSKNTVLNKTKGSRHQFSLNTGVIYTFKCELPKSARINRVILPVKIRKGYEHQGIIRFQLFKEFENGALKQPFTQAFEFADLSEIDKEIILEFPEEVVDEEFYIAATRDVNSSTRVSEGAFNPFLSFSRSSNPDDIEYRHILSTKWFNLSWALGDTDYKLIFEAYGSPIND